VGPSVGLDDEKRKSLTVPELQLLGRPARSQSLSRLPSCLSMGSHIECTSGINWLRSVLRMTRKTRHQLPIMRGELNKLANLSMSSNKNNC
jgi:hypothetical protein